MLMHTCVDLLTVMHLQVSCGELAASNPGSVKILTRKSNKSHTPKTPRMSEEICCLGLVTLVLLSNTILQGGNNHAHALTYM